MHDDGDWTTHEMDEVPPVTVWDSIYEQGWCVTLLAAIKKGEGDD